MQKDKIKKRLLITAGIIILLLVVRIYLNHREVVVTADPTTNWNVYTNVKYGYQIKYPPTWSVREFPDTKQGAAFSPDSTVSTPATEVFGISANGRTPDDCKLSLEDYVKVSGIHNIQNFKKLDSINPAVTTSKESGFKTTWDVINDGKTTESGPFTYFKDVTQECSANTGDILFLSQTTDYLDIYQEMTSTFKFVKE